MNATLIAVFTFAGTALLIGTVTPLVYDRLVKYPATVRQRLRNATGKTGGQKTTALLNIKQLSDAAATAPNAWWAGATEVVEQSGVRIELRSMVLGSLALSVVAAIAASLAVGTWWSTAAAAAIGFIAPWSYVYGCRQVRVRRLTRQLPDALDVICRGVRAGQTVPACIQMVADDFSPPLSDEFRHCYEQQNLGISYDASLRNLARRTGIMELRILVVALIVQSRSGGSLVDLMQNLASMVRKRLVLQQKVKALTGEGRMQAMVLIALPFFVFLAIYFLNREYAQVLLDRPWLLGGCAAAQAVGVALIRKLIQIDY